MLSGSAESLVRRRSLWTACFLILVLVASGLLRADAHLLGDERAEIFGHAWVQWWHAEALPQWPAGTDLAAGSLDWPVVDPLTTGIAALLSCLIGATASWNGVILLWGALCVWGGATLASRAGGSPLRGVSLFLRSIWAPFRPDSLKIWGLASWLSPWLFCSIHGLLEIGSWGVLFSDCAHGVGSTWHLWVPLSLYFAG